MSDSPDSKDTLIKQSEVMIGLLARLSIGVDHIKELVTDKKRNPAAYVKAYNALTSSLSVTDAARVAKSDQGNMSRILKRWEAEGIVYNVGTEHKPAYKHLLVLS